VAKCKYKKDFPQRAEDMARQGYTDEAIARKLGIGIRTFYDYAKRYPQFSQALERGKAPVDFEVENALLKRALGYEYEEVKIESLERDDELEKSGEVVAGKSGTVKRVTKVIKKVAPDTNAAKFWLKNRRPNTWRDKHDIKHSGDISINIDSDDANL
jgi:transposase